MLEHPFCLCYNWYFMLVGGYLLYPPLYLKLDFSYFLLYLLEKLAVFVVKVNFFRGILSSIISLFLRNNKYEA